MEDLFGDPVVIRQVCFADQNLCISKNQLTLNDKSGKIIRVYSLDLCT